MHNGMLFYINLIHLQSVCKYIKEWPSCNILTFSSSAHDHLKQLHSIIVLSQRLSVSDEFVGCHCLVCWGSLCCPQSHTWYEHQSLLQAHTHQLYLHVLCFLLSLYAAPLNPFEHTEHTIPEEYIVVFKQDACKTQGNIYAYINILYSYLVMLLHCSPGTHEITEWYIGSIWWSLLCQAHLWFGQFPWILCSHGWDVRS